MTPTNHKYPLRTLSDLLELTPAQIDRLLPDLKTWHTINQDPEKLLGHAIPEGATLQRDGFIWVDDGGHDGTVNVNYKLKEDGPTIHTTTRNVSPEGTITSPPFSDLSLREKIAFALGRAIRYAIWFPIKYTFKSFGWLTTNAVELSTALVFFILIAITTYMEDGTPDWDKAATWATAILCLWLVALIFGKGFGDGMARTKAMHWTTHNDNTVMLNGDQLNPVDTIKGDCASRPISPDGANK